MREFKLFADIAQSAERVLGKDEVVSSSLIISSMKIQKQRFSGFSETAVF